MIKKANIFIDKYYNWEELSKIGNLKLLNSTYYFFVLIPIVVNILKGIEKNAKIIAFSEEYGITIGLPFSWQKLYFSSIAFVIGKLIYLYYCPKLIKDYENFDEFAKTGKSMFYINDLAIGDIKFQKTVKINFGEKEINSNPDLQIPNHVQFNNSRAYFKNKFLIARILTALLFGAGIVLLVNVMFQKFWFTISYIIN